MLRMLSRPVNEYYLCIGILVIFFVKTSIGKPIAESLILQCKDGLFPKTGEYCPVGFESVQGCCRKCPSCPPGYGIDGREAFKSQFRDQCMRCQYCVKEREFIQIREEPKGERVSLCMPCTNCSVLSRDTENECRLDGSYTKDTECGPCWFGFYEATTSNGRTRLNSECYPCKDREDLQQRLACRTYFESLDLVLQLKSTQAEQSTANTQQYNNTTISGTNYSSFSTNASISEITQVTPTYRTDKHVAVAIAVVIGVVAFFFGLFIVMMVKQLVKTRKNRNRSTRRRREENMEMSVVRPLVNPSEMPATANEDLTSNETSSSISQSAAFSAGREHTGTATVRKEIHTDATSTSSSVTEENLADPIFTGDYETDDEYERDLSSGLSTTYVKTVPSLRSDCVPNANTSVKRLASLHIPLSSSDAGHDTTHLKELVSIESPSSPDLSDPSIATQYGNPGKGRDLELSLDQERIASHQDETNETSLTHHPLQVMEDSGHPVQDDEGDIHQPMAFGQLEIETPNTPPSYPSAGTLPPVQEDTSRLPLLDTGNNRIFSQISTS